MLLDDILHVARSMVTTLGRKPYLSLESGCDPPRLARDVAQPEEFSVGELEVQLRVEDGDPWLKIVQGLPKHAGCVTAPLFAEVTIGLRLLHKHCGDLGLLTRNWM
ncbi:MAG: hypothetical protein O7G83_02980 [Proteobacteria bacterium]|nr:hypothetical protein [Pseudomonadota bacterium]